MRKQSLQKIKPPGRVVLNIRNGTGKGARIAGKEIADGMEIGREAQTIKCKAEETIESHPTR
jgi:hypothetical protein